MTATAKLKYQPIEAAEDTFVRWLEDRMNERGMDADDLQEALGIPTSKKTARIINGTDAHNLTIDELINLAALFNVDPYMLYMRYDLGGDKLGLKEFRQRVLWDNGYKLSREMHEA